MSSDWYFISLFRPYGLGLYDRCIDMSIFWKLHSKRVTFLRARRQPSSIRGGSFVKEAKNVVFATLSTSPFSMRWVGKYPSRNPCSPILGKFSTGTVTTELRMLLSVIGENAPFDLVWHDRGTSRRRKGRWERLQLAVDIEGGSSRQAYVILDKRSWSGLGLEGDLTHLGFNNHCLSFWLSFWFWILLALALALALKIVNAIAGLEPIPRYFFIDLH